MRTPGQEKAWFPRADSDHSKQPALSASTYEVGRRTGTLATSVPTAHLYVSGILHRSDYLLRSVVNSHNGPLQYAPRGIRLATFQTIHPCTSVYKVRRCKELLGTPHWIRVLPCPRSSRSFANRRG